MSLALQVGAGEVAEPLIRFLPLGEAGSGQRLPLHRLGPEGPAECWQVPGVLIDAAESEGFRLRRSGGWCFGEIHCRERPGESLEDLAEGLYRALERHLAAHPRDHLLRVWTYLDRLNEGAGDAERYRRFCVGRHRALARPGFEARLTAATVIGAHEPGLWLHFLTGPQPGRAVENPRQTSAWRYPRDYGPVSPSFARATRVGELLLVSGTAAVVGHQTLHPHDARAQLDETLANLQALLAAACEGPETAAGWQPQALRLYVRHPAEGPALVEALRRAYPRPGLPLMVLRGAISRADLAMEIEGVWRRG